MDLGLLWQGINGIVCGGDDSCGYVRIGVTLDLVIVARILSRRLFTLILVGRVLPFYIFCVDFCFLIGKL